jgi:hypothetical protein
MATALYQFATVQIEQAKAVEALATVRRLNGESCARR